MSAPEVTPGNGDEAAILQKIRKLMRLAAGNANAHEAAAAAAKAQELIQRYKLDAATLDATDDDEAKRRAEKVQGYYENPAVETTTRYNPADAGVWEVVRVSPCSAVAKKAGTVHRRFEVTTERVRDPRTGELVKRPLAEPKIVEGDFPETRTITISPRAMVRRLA